MTYLDPVEVVSARVTEVPHSGRTQSGYGGNLPTPYLLTLPDGRERRVRAMCYGNAATHFIRVAGEDVYLDFDLAPYVTEVK